MCCSTILGGAKNSTLCPKSARRLYTYACGGTSHLPYNGAVLGWVLFRFTCFATCETCTSCVSETMNCVMPAHRYPDKPPRVRFTCPMFHPNVYDDGTVCLDIIQDQWSPCHNICTLLTSIRSLLNDPNTSSPANIDAANLYQKDRAAYNKRVRRLAQQTLECC